MVSLLSGGRWSCGFRATNPNSYPTCFCCHLRTRVVDAAIEANYIFVLTGVAVLWRPQKNAKEYAYVMQLPSSKADDDQDGEEGEFEMSAVVPSAADFDDDDDDDGEEMFHDEPATK
jgi:hypothetical protein